MLRLLFAFSCLSAAAHAGGNYTFVDLGTLGGDDSGALGLNDLGQVVGWSTIPGCTTGGGDPCRRAFLWEDGVMTDLGFLAGDEGSAALAINDSGVIVGNSERDVVGSSGTYHAVIWSSVGPPTPLPDLGAGTSWANDINAAGTVVGYAVDPLVVRDRVVTWQAGAIANVGSTEPHSFNRGHGISDDGKLVGMAWNLFSPNDSIAYDGGWTQLGGFGPFENSEAWDLNDAGLAVGTQAFPSGNWHAATWQLGQSGATDLGVLPGHSLAYLLDVNESGFAVGYSLDDSGPVQTRAIFTDGVTLTDLNDLLPPGTKALLWDAMEINEHGDIVGTALVDGSFRAYLLEATAPTSFCDGADGSLAACPCGNAGAPDTGCDIQQGTGGVGLSVVAQETSPQNRVTWSGTGFPVASNPSSVVIRAADLDASSPVVFGDGLRCIGVPVVRLAAAFASGGTSTHTHGHGAGAGSGTFYYQLWFRNTPAMYCTPDAFNLSNGRTLTW